jgi:orotate phosphoribosyltransferase
VLPQASIERAKENKRFQDIDKLCEQCGISKTLYDDVLHGVARNVKMGPWTATSGISLPYLLNASTNFLDKDISPKIVQVFGLIMSGWLPKLPEGERYLVCGMELAGGILAAQLASANHEVLNALGDFVYIRKEKKTSGTLQQLEGPNFITQRTPNSPPATGVWVDDANSTGSSLKAGIQLLKRDYNINITHALYLVDRQKDREDLPEERQHLADPLFEHVDVKAVFDLEQVDALIPKNASE